MKLRSQRTHFMGNSNRQNHFLVTKKNEEFLQSHSRSNSFQSSTNVNQRLSSQSELKIMVKDNPFRGTHN
jgi:hypothetical protein